MRIELLRGLDIFVRSLNDEEYMFESWLMGGLPDGYDMEELEYICGKNEDFYYILQTFINHVCKKPIQRDGLYFWDSKMLVVGSEFEKENNNESCN